MMRPAFSGKKLVLTSGPESVRTTPHTMRAA